MLYTNKKKATDSKHLSKMDALERELGKPSLPQIRVGDDVEVGYLIKEGEKERVQYFIGRVIAIHGRGIRRSILVRRIVANEGVERVFPLHSPRVAELVVKRSNRVRRSKLYFQRAQVGKGVRLRELFDGARAPGEPGEPGESGDAGAVGTPALASAKA
jgi:large subunit ribosomal protein L19